MAHNLHVDAAGKVAMFIVGTRKDAWHELGQRCTDAVNAEQAMELARLNWKVIKVQNYARNAAGVAVPTASYTVFRDSDNAELGTVGAGYAIRQNWQHFEFADTLLEANGGSHYDSAGALGNGARIWLSIRLPKADYSIGEDKHELYLVVTSSHDGSGAHKAKISDVRVVCQNTLNAALRDSDTGKLFSVRHTKNGAARLDNAKSLMSGVLQNATTIKDKLELLARRKITRESMATIFDRLFPKPKDEEINTTRRENVLAEILSLYESNDNNAFPDQRGSAYNLLNAVTEYTDHYRNARITKAREGMALNTARAENAVDGSGETVKSNALEIIMQCTEGAPSHQYITNRSEAPSSGSLLDTVISNHN